MAHPDDDAVFHALADATRRALLDELAERADQSLFELCTRLTMKHGIGSTRQAISQHLAVLEAAGLVESRREGRCKLHRFNPRPLLAIVQRWPIPTEEPSPCGSS
ncbi:MAG: helix-turn-helix transcriptional regulator [Alphaproteobacteria bacterium]|nr:helix-turn-helix transcriptional regulator [Alphaproteobacteria bacterium]